MSKPPPKSRLILGNNMEVMAGFPDNSVDTIITDPPYGLSFMGKKWDYDVPGVATFVECLRVLKSGGTMLCFAGSRTQHRMAVNVEDAGFILKDCIMWLYGSGFPKATDISKQLDKGVRKPELVPTKQGNTKFDRGTTYSTDTHTGFTNISPPATPEAILWNGWKSHGLKPAYEPILVAMKPNDGSYANNALKWGVSGLNIEGGRIGTEQIEQGREGRGVADSTSYHDGLKPTERTMATGRFPANIILDEGVAKQAGEWSRYFYCAKASKSERNAGCEGLEDIKTNDGRQVDADNAYQRGKSLRKNHHPTVKPLALMEYLCTLTKTPTGGIVLDPFMGSGTTGLACKNLGRGFIGIEKDEKYFKIARARIRG